MFIDFGVPWVPYCDFWGPLGHPSREGVAGLCQTVNHPGGDNYGMQSTLSNHRLAIAKPSCDHHDGATGRCQVPQDGAKCHRTVPGTTGWCQVPQDGARCHRTVPQDSARYHRTVPGATGRCQMPQDGARYHRTVPGATGWCQVPQDAARCHRAVPSATGRCQVPSDL